MLQPLLMLATIPHHTIPSAPPCLQPIHTILNQQSYGRATKRHTSSVFELVKNECVSGIGNLNFPYQQLEDSDFLFWYILK